ncbi:protein ImpG/VasA [Klebsiella michiganensis]|nr:protein ImpG/VasA [Klebsiella michiganensis]
MSVTLRGLENVDFPEELAWFEIDIVLERQWPHEYALSEKHLRLHCTPVINLFPLESDPLHLDSLQTEYLLRPMRVQDGHTEIYSVDSVTSLAPLRSPDVCAVHQLPSQGRNAAP